MKAVLKFAIDYPALIAAVAVVLMALPLILKAIIIAQQLGN